MRLNIINGRVERRNDLLKELQRLNITDYELWDGIFLPSVKESINAAHKQIVEYAKLAQWEEVLIAEDDFIGTHPNSFNYFIENKPKDYDLYLAQVYLGDIGRNNKVKKFTGLTMYFVHSKFYDTFLSVDPKEHIDVALSGLGDYHVCNPFAFIQRNGFSSNTGKEEKYDQLLQNRQLYTG